MVKRQDLSTIIVKFHPTYFHPVDYVECARSIKKTIGTEKLLVFLYLSILYIEDA